ncbi:kinase-like domain-containing protein [Aspergillus crustosus]
MSALRRLPLSARRTIVSFTRKPLWNVPSLPSASIPQEERVDEERHPSYNPKAFYPAKPEEVLDNRYQLLVKVGWGSRSTRPVTVKIINRRRADSPQFEWDMESLLAEQNPSHRGRSVLRTFTDSFIVNTAEGSHSCLVYKPMRETFNIFQRRFVDDKIPLPLVKAYVSVLLWALDYLHSECHVVHCDLKLDNILMTFENDTVLPNFLKDQQPMEFKIDQATKRPIYRCHNNVGHLQLEDLKEMFPMLADFGQATRLEQDSPDAGENTEHLGIYPVQSNFYRAPEAILGCGWEFKADIWNFGVLLWNIVGGTELFTQVLDTNKHYNAKSHLAEMIALLGPPPARLLEKSRDRIETPWPTAYYNEIGKLCHNTKEFLDGPFFDGEERPRGMLAWRPEDRKTARELLEHPFLGFAKKP